MQGGVKFFRNCSYKLSVYLLALPLFLFLTRWCLLDLYRVSEFACGDILYHVSLFASSDQRTSILLSIYQKNQENPKNMTFT